MTATVLAFPQHRVSRPVAPVWIDGSGVCGAGPGPCGAGGARLFTAGWRCRACAPVSHRMPGDNKPTRAEEVGV